MIRGIDCQWLLDGTRCNVAEQLVNNKVQCTTSKKACVQCLRTDRPRQPNRVTAMIGLSQVRRQLGIEEWQTLRQHMDEILDTLPSPLTPAELKYGAGSELHRLLGYIGLKEMPGCACLRRIREMNDHGEDWCDQHIDEIVGWLREESERRGAGWTIVHAAGAKRIVKAAIRRSRKKALANAKAEE